MQFIPGKLYKSKQTLYCYTEEPKISGKRFSVLPGSLLLFIDYGRKRHWKDSRLHSYHFLLGDKKIWFVFNSSESLDEYFEELKANE